MPEPTDHTAEPVSSTPAEPRGVGWRLARDEDIQRHAEQPFFDGAEANGLATHLCSFDGCSPAPCADHLSTAGAALKWAANRRALGVEQPAPARPPAIGTCPACSRPVFSIRDQGDDGLTVARQWLPCGCTRIVPVGGDRG